MTNDRIDPELTTVRHIERVPEDVIAAAARLPSSTIHEAAGKTGALPSAIKPVAPSFRISGPAVTVHSPPGDNLWLHRALYVARPGDILVVYVGGKFEHGYWGEIMSTAARKQGLGGLVIDGCVRDSELLLTVGFPIFARGLCICGTGKDFGARGWINAPVLIGDVTVMVSWPFRAPALLTQSMQASVVKSKSSRSFSTSSRANPRWTSSVGIE